MTNDHNQVVIKRPILLVEDNPMDVDLTIQACRELGITHQIEVCRDGEEALEYIKSHPSAADAKFPALVLLDLRMPKVSGFEVLTAARGDVNWRQVPIVVLTTSTQLSDVNAAYENGVNSYLVKPVDSSDFASLMQAVNIYWLQANHPPYPTLIGRIL
ncbi:MAG TPA: response regulator [Capsulimonadaceae bacterium]|jgi:CheY-like chemotaxis protein